GSSFVSARISPMLSFSKLPAISELPISMVIAVMLLGSCQGDDEVEQGGVANVTDASPSDVPILVLDGFGSHGADTANAPGSGTDAPVDAPDERSMLTDAEADAPGHPLSTFCGDGIRDPQKEECDDEVAAESGCCTRDCRVRETVAYAA